LGKTGDRDESRRKRRKGELLVKVLANLGFATCYKNASKGREGEGK